MNKIIKYSEIKFHVEAENFDEKIKYATISSSIDFLPWEILQLIPALTNAKTTINMFFFWVPLNSHHRYHLRKSCIDSFGHIIFFVFLFLYYAENFYLMTFGFPFLSFTFSAHIRKSMI